MYHASAHQFDFPDYDALVANITNHDNGRLGRWVATTADWIKGFGGHVYTMEISGTVMDLPLAQLKKWADENLDNPDFYKHHRQELLLQGIDYLQLIEADGHSAMGVV